MRRRYADQREASGLTWERFNAIVRVMMGCRQLEPKPENWVFCAERVAAMERHKQWPRIAKGPCCGLAQVFGCVCIVAWECPEHGTHHYGSHE